MKRIALTVTIASVALFSPVAGYSQTATTPGATATGEKKASLSSSDKQLVKSAGEAQTGLKHLAEVANANSPASDSVKELSKKVLAELTPAWGDLATAAKGTELPKTDQTAGEKRDLGELRKQKDATKFDKAYLKDLEKEAKKAATIFANGAKSASDAELKAYFTTWQPKLAALSTEVSTAESEAGKKK